MIHRISFLLLFHILLAQIEHPSIHQEQLEKYKAKLNPTVEKIHVLTGLDVLLEKKQNVIQGKSIALVTNHTGIDRFGISNYKRLMTMRDVDLKVIFTPEHGLFGEADAGERVTYSKNNLKLPDVISLYGETRKPSIEMLEGIDLILYDIQDIGARFYTYITTLGLVMESAAELGISVIVLDRPNPIRGDIIEGPILKLDYQTFVGYYPIPIRYGGTVGGLAQKIIANKWISPVPIVEVIEMEGWEPSLWYDETDLPWIKPSPNIPDLETAIIYPGMCIIEGTNLSEGRGTQNPFKQIGAPWVDGKLLSQKLNKFNLPGVVFKPALFTPISIPGMSTNPKFQDEKCSGIEIVILDRNNYNSVNTGIITLFIFYSMYTDNITFKEKHLNRLWGSDQLLKGIKKGTSPLDFIQSIQH